MPGGATTITADLLGRLRKHYVKPTDWGSGGVLLPEVTLGFGGGPRCDAIAAGFTSASGRLLVGHEIKASHSDWKREFDKIRRGGEGKADAWADQLQAWYIVAPDTGVVPLEELPPEWGLMLPATRGAGVKIVKRAQVHTDRRPSAAAVVSILSRLDTLAVAEQRRRDGDAEHRIRAQIAREHEREPGRPITGGERSRLALLDRLEQLAGAKLDHYTSLDNPHVGPVASPDTFAAALKLAAALGHLPHLDAGADRSAAALEAAAAELRAMAKLAARLRKDPAAALR